MKYITLILSLIILANLLYGQGIPHIYEFRSDTLHGATERNNPIEVLRLIREGENVNTILRPPLSKETVAPLHIAAFWGYYEVAELVIKKRANVNIKNNFGNTPLHKAAFLGKDDIVQLLVDNKANINVQNNDGETPLHLGVVPGVTGPIIADILLQAGANKEAKDIKGQTPLHIAVANGSYDALKVLIENKADVNAKCNKKRTILHYASRNVEDYDYSILNDKNLVNDILKRFKETRWRSSNETVYYVAYSANMVESLIESGADPNIRDIEGETPLHYAAFFCNQLALVALLKNKELNNIDVNSIDNNGYTPMHWAAYSINSNIVRLLFESGAKIQPVNKNNGKTPLHHSSYIGRYETSKYLIDNGADINAKDKNKRTPLFYAVNYSNNYELIELLKSLGAK